MHRATSPPAAGMGLPDFAKAVADCQHLLPFHHYCRRRTSDIPVFMMVSPQAGTLPTDGTGTETHLRIFWAYTKHWNTVDTAVLLILNVLPNAKIAGTIYNQSEPQSVDALARIENTCRRQDCGLKKLPSQFE